MRIARPVAHLLGACLAVGVVACAEGAFLWRATTVSRLPGDGTAWLWMMAESTVVPLGCGLFLGAVAAAAWRIRGAEAPAQAGIAFAVAGIWAVPPVAAVIAVTRALPRGEWTDVALIGGIVLVALLSARWRVIGPVLVAGALFTLPWRVGTSAPAAKVRVSSPSGPTVVLVTLDTFRADHMGAIGGFKYPVQTDHLDRLANEGRLFTNAVALVPLTLPSHTSMLTGEAPWDAAVVRNGDRVSEDAKTVVEAFYAAGYRTGAFVSAAVLPARAGLARGFDHYDDRLSMASFVNEAALPWVLSRVGLTSSRAFRRSGEITVARAIDWLESSSEPAFLWVHLYDTHAPYSPPPPYSTMYAPDPSLAPPTEVRGHSFMKRLFLPKDIPGAIAKYSGEATFTDHVVGQLLEKLPADARIVVAGDHGESLYEHGYYLNHGESLHQPSLQVPLLVVARGLVPAGERVAEPVALTRVGPTLLKLAGLPAEGPTLLDPPSDEWLVSYAAAQQARITADVKRAQLVSWRRGSEKWIVDSAGKVERFDLASDPGEEVDTSAGHPDAAARSEQGRLFLERLRAVERQAPESRDAADLEALEALGYVN